MSLYNSMLLIIALLPYAEKSSRVVVSNKKHTFLESVSKKVRHIRKSDP